MIETIITAIEEPGFGWFAVGMFCVAIMLMVAAA
jgi:hypothetical protein